MSNLRYKKKIHAYKLGYFAEILVIVILIFKFHKILRHRYISPFGEIDIIALRGNVISFVEVKARSNHRMLSQSITLKKQSRIFKSAKAFMARYPKAANYEQRFMGYLISWKGIEVVNLYNF